MGDKTPPSENNGDPTGPSVAELTKEGFKVLTEAVRNSNALPAGRDYNFYTTSDFFRDFTTNQGNDIMRLMNNILHHYGIDSNIKHRILSAKTELIIDANDHIFEKVADNIDELNGIKKTGVDPVELQTVSAQMPLINESWNRNNKQNFFIQNKALNTSKIAFSQCIKLITAKNIVRPQKFFKDKIDNGNSHPWQPRITDKPNSLKPLSIFLEEYGESQEYSHPYEFELERFQPLSGQLLAPEKPIFPKPSTETPLIEIETEEQLGGLVETLRGCTEFAVDLEHHSYRSFMGFTCLMQISTRENDYLIDTLSLRDKLWMLNEVFTKPSIVKIFHGADNDIEWLQRDLSLYVVNMFDTHQAARVLEYSALSLAYLLRRFCHIVANKQFQLADWRIRPLPDELKAYAREDTHYLIYIYETLKNELLKKANGSDNLIRAVFERSTDVCRKRYFKPILTDESHLNIYRRSRKMFNNRQLYALKELYAWRDLLAREEDESTGYVLPNHMLLQISETLPREVQGILACCNPIPPLVRSHLLEIHQIILKAREQTIEKPILKEDSRARGGLMKMSKINMDSPLHCPHDLTKSSELSENLPTLLNKDLTSRPNKSLGKKSKLDKTCSVYSIFNSSEETVSTNRETVKKGKFSYLSPFERYKLVKPVIAEAERQAAEQREQTDGLEIEQTTDKVSEEITTENVAEEKTKEQNDERTDEERIASVREHFLNLNKEFNEAQKRQEMEELEQERSLLQQGGSKKRKREPEEPREELDAPVQDDPYHLRKIRVSRPFVRELKRKAGLEGRFKKQNKRKKTTVENEQERSRSEDEEEKRRIENSVRIGPKLNWKQMGLNKKAKKQTKKFEAFDYGSVDFNQFQGGAGGSSNNQQIKSNFKNKRPRKSGNKGAKFARFSGPIKSEVKREKRF